MKVRNIRVTSSIAFSETGVCCGVSASSVLYINPHSLLSFYAEVLRIAGMLPIRAAKCEWCIHCISFLTTVFVYVLSLNSYAATGPTSDFSLLVDSDGRNGAKKGTAYGQGWRIVYRHTGGILGSNSRLRTSFSSQTRVFTVAHRTSICTVCRPGD